MSTPRGILFATVDSSWAGAQAQMLELAAGLNRTEFEPVLLTAGAGELVARSRALGIRTYTVPYRCMRRVFPFAGYYALAPLLLGRILRAERIALVHTHDPHAALPIMRSARGRAMPLVSHIHDFDQRWLTARTRALLVSPNAVVVAVSEACARYARDQGAMPERVHRIYNGVYLPVMSPGARASARRALGIGDGEIAVALVGRLVRRKGQEELIRAMAHPRVSALAVRTFLIGRGEHSEPGYEAFLRQLIDAHGLSGRVTVLPHREDVPSLLAGIDICAMPSRREAFGRVAVEAMHAGTPVIVANEGGLPELVRDGREGLVIQPGDVGALAAAIERLACDPGLRARLGGAGRVRAAAFSHESFVEDVSALYRALLGTHMPTRARDE